MTRRYLHLLALSMVLANCADQSSEGMDAQDAIASMYAPRLQSFQSAPSPSDMADAYVADVAVDAVWMPQNSVPIEGRDAIRDWAVEFFSAYQLVVGAQVDAPLEISEGIALRRFTTTGVYVDRTTQAQYPFDQKYIDILKLQPDGTWKLALHMWSSNGSGQSIW